MDDGKTLDRADGERCRRASGSRASCRRSMPKAPSTSRSAAAKTTTSRVYVYKSTDFGKTFTSIADNIPAGSVNVIREDPAIAERPLSSGPTSARSCRPTAAGSGRCSAATCRRCRCPTSSISRRPGHRDLDLRPRDVGARRQGGQVKRVTGPSGSLAPCWLDHVRESPRRTSARARQGDPVAAVRGDDVPAAGRAAGQRVLLREAGSRRGRSRKSSPAAGRRSRCDSASTASAALVQIDAIWLPSASKNLAGVQNCAQRRRASGGSFQIGRQDPLVFPRELAAADELHQPARQAERADRHERRNRSWRRPGASPLRRSGRDVTPRSILWLFLRRRADPVLGVCRVHEHQADDVGAIVVREHAHHDAAERVADQHVRRGNGGYRQQRPQLARDAACGAGSGPASSKTTLAASSGGLLRRIDDFKPGGERLPRHLAPSASSPALLRPGKYSSASQLRYL